MTTYLYIIYIYVYNYKADQFLSYITDDSVRALNYNILYISNSHIIKYTIFSHTSHNPRWGVLQRVDISADASRRHVVIDDDVANIIQIVHNSYNVQYSIHITFII